MEERDYFLPNAHPLCPQKLTGGLGQTTLNQNSTTVDRIDLAEKIHTFLSVATDTGSLWRQLRARTQSPFMER